MKKTIRLATPADIETIFAIRTSVKENHLSHRQLGAMGITPDTIREALEAQPCIWIAEIDGVAAGFTMVDPDDACVFAAFVMPDHEGHGLGRLLLEKAEAVLFETHATIWLETNGKSRAAGFYAARGWKPVETLGNGDVRFEKNR